MRLAYLIVIASILALAVPSYSAIYKWVDGHEQVHYTDDLKKVPERFREKARDFDTIEQKGSVTYDPALGASSPETAEEPFWKSFLRQEEERTKVAKKPKVILYMADW